MFVPRSHGGLELALPAGLAVISALARIDGSVGWTAIVASGGRHFLGLGTTRNLRSHLSERAGRGDLRILAAGRNGRACCGRLADQRPLAVRQRLHACRVDRRILRRNRRRQSSRRRARGGRGFVALCCRRKTGRSRTAGMRPGSRAPAAITSCCRTRWFLKSSLFDLEGGIPCAARPLYPAVRHLLPLFHAAFSVGMAEGAAGRTGGACPDRTAAIIRPPARCRSPRSSSSSLAGFTPTSARRRPSCKSRSRATGIMR